MATPLPIIKLTLYDENNEIKRELVRTFIPWGILEVALDLQDDFSNIETDKDGKPINIQREQIEKLTEFVMFLFGNSVTSEELNIGASLQDMFSTFRQVFVMVEQSMAANPTIGQTVKRRANLPRK